MRRSEAEHVLRAAAAIAQEQSFVVVGAKLVEIDTLRRRIGMLDAGRYPLAHVISWVERRHLEAQATS